MKYIKDTFNSFSKKRLFIFVLLFSLAGYTLVVFAVAPPGGYAPGQTLDPDCAYNDADCFVTIPVLTFDAPLIDTSGVISLPAAAAGVDGYLSASDWNNFNDKQDGFGFGTSAQYLRGDNTWQDLDTSVVPENGNLYFTNGRFDTRLATATSAANLQTVGTITSGVWHGSQITDAYISDSITASNYIPLSQKGAANGVASLGGDGKVLSSQLSSFSLSDTFVVNSEAEMLNLLSAELGDVAIRLDENKSYILTTNDPTNIANWQLIITPLDFVLAVNGQVGAVSLTTTDIPEGLNLYYTDSRVDDYLNTQKGVANGIASLDANGKIPTSQLGSIILNETRVVVDIPAMLAIVGATNGDLTVVTSTSQTFVLADDNDPSNINSWVEIVNGSPVTSVNGQVGTVNLTTTNISEGSNQYFTNTRARNAFSATGPLNYNSVTGVFGITQANNITNGFLSAVDWNTFDSKQDALTFGSVTASSNPEITITGGTGAVIGTGLDISIPDASDSVRGLITTGAQNFGGVKTFNDNVGIGDSAPSTLFSVGLGGLFQVDNTGDLVKIKNINYTWPGTQGATDSVLVNDGSGGLTWASNGITSLNGLTDATQTFTTSSTGTDFSISSSSGIHTFNFPSASATARGALTSTKYTEFNNKPFVDTTYNNIYVGSISAGTAMNGAGGGANNIVMGYQAGDTLSTGSNNTFLGYQSGKSVVAGVTNSAFIGRQAGLGATGASYAAFIGRQAGQSATGAQYGVFIGDNAGNTASSASNAIFLGQESGYQATSASYSNFIGTSAGRNATGTTAANFIGYGAGYTATDADYSNFFGRLSGNAANNAQYSNFFGFQSGYNATNAANSIFIGKNAGNGDLVNNTVSGSSIAIGDSAGTGGFSNSIAIGASAVNTATNQFLIGSTYTNFNVRGVNYVWPSAQAAGSGYTLTNDGSGNLSWATGLSIGGTSGQLQYNNSGALGGVTGVTYDGTNFDAKDSVFRIVDNSDTTKRAIFEVSGIDAGTTRTYTFPNAAGTIALTSDLSGYLSRTGGTMTGSLILAAGTTSFAPLKLQSGTNLTTAEAGAFEYNGSSLMFTRSGTLRAGVLMTDIASPYNTYDAASKGVTAFTSGTDNFLAGSGAGSGMTTASNSIAIGNGALTGAGANYSIALGKSAGNGTAVSSSFFAGLNAGSSATGANYSNFFGENAGSGATAAANSNFFGYYAGSGASGASYANFFGWGAGTSATNAVDTVGIGQNAARNATGSIESIFIGKNAGYNAVSTGITGDYNIGLGTETGKSLTTGAHNTFLGYQSGRNVTAGTGNFMVGYQAGYNGGDSYNNFLGYTAGSGATTVQQSNFLGPNAGTNAIFASYANFLGPNAGSGATYGSYSNFFGNAAGLNATSATSSNFFGNNAGNTATNATLSNFIGNGAGYQATNASYANFFGSDAGRSATGAIDSIFIGQNAGRNATGAIESIFIGKNAGYNSVSTGITGDYNIGLGTETGKSLTTGAHNTFLGYQSGRNVTAGTGNFMVGYQAGYNGGDSYNNFLGYTAGYGATTVQQSNFIGPNTGTNAIFASYSNFLGPNAGYGATYGSYSNFLGQAAGLNATNATASNFIGGSAGSGATNAANSNFLGNLSGYGAIGAVDSIFIGQNSGRNATDSVESIFLGKNAGYNSTSTGVTGDYNIGLGSSSGLAITTGSYNVMLGYQTSNALTTGSKNVGIGYDLDFASNTADGQLTIQNIIFGTGNTGTGTTASTGNIGIGIAAPSARLNLPAGTATASTAPLKFTAGTNLTTPEAGVMEFTIGNFWLSPTTTNRFRIGHGGSGSSGTTNIVFGIDSGTALTTGSAANTYIGRLVGTSQTNGIGNTGIGSGALGLHTGYTGNTAIGEAAMYYGSGSINVAIGDYAMFSDSSVNTSNYGIAIGGNAFYKKSSGDGGIAIGYNAGLTVSSAAKSIIIGYNAVNGGVHTGTNTIAIGEEAGKILTSGGHNTLIGYQSGATVTTGTMNNFMGYQAGYNTNAATGYANFIGYQAGYGTSTSGTTSNFIGYKAGYNSGYSIQNNFIGNEAGYGSSASDANFIGTSAGYQASAASRGNFFGKQAGENATNAVDSVFMGTSAGRNATGSIESIFIGLNAGYNAVSTGITGDYNIGLGTSAAAAVTTGAYNILLGYQSGDTITSGSNNIIIGKSLDAQSATSSDQLSIQNIIFGTGNSATGTTVSSGKIGIGVSPTTYRFEVSDTSTGAAISSFTNSDGTCTLDPGDVSGWSCPSDLNLKKDITTLESGSLDQLLALRPVNYRLRNEDGSAVLSTGLIAQEVQGVFPKLVKIQADGTLALNYGGLTPYIIKAIQEMNLQITEINDIEKPNSWRDALVAWFANTANGITEFFSKKVSTEELCVKDSAGQTCITRAQLDALLNGQVVTSPTPAPDPTPDPVPSPDPTPSPDPGTDAPPSDIIPPLSNPTPTPEPPASDSVPTPDPGV